MCACKLPRQLVMPAALLLAGLAASAGVQAQCISAADAEANGCIGEVRVDSPQMSVTGQSAYVQPGQAVQFTAQAFTGTSTSSSRAPTRCDNGWDWQVFNPLGDVIDPASIIINGDRMSIAAENNPGIGRVQATCRDNPSITDEVTVQAGGALAPAPPAVGAGGQATGSGSFGFGAKAATPPAPGAGGMSQGAKTGLVVGGVLVGTALLVGAAVAAADTTTSGSGGGGECAHITYNACCSGATIGDGAADCGVDPPCGCPSGTVRIGTYNGQATCSCQ